MLGMHAKIERFGWTCMYVFGDRKTHAPAWGYTIGLAERARHPELVVVGLDDHSVAAIFEVLATRVTTGERLDDPPGGRLTIQEHPFRVVPVHPSHWTTDRFNMWLAYYALLGEADPPQDALQVLWPDDHDQLPDDPAFERRLLRVQTRLDRPARPHRCDRPHQPA